MPFISLFLFVVQMIGAVDLFCFQFLDHMRMISFPVFLIPDRIAVKVARKDYRLIV